MQSLGDYDKYKWVSVHRTWGMTKSIGIRACNRHGHTAEVFGHRMYIVGGGSSSGSSGPLFCFDAKHNRWRDLSTGGTPRPSTEALYNASTAAGEYILLLGPPEDGRLWLFDVVLEEWVYTDCLLDKLDAPIFMMFEYMEHLNSCIAFGGKRTDGQSASDVNALAMETFRWAKPNMSGSLPGGISNMASCVVQKDIYVFGGTCRGKGSLNSLYILHCEHPGAMRWSQPVIRKERPSPRTNSTLTNVSNGKLMLIGGFGAGFFQDMWVYSVKEEEWKRLREQNRTVTGRIPRISQHATAYVANKLIITGSHDGELYDRFVELEGDP